MLQAGSVAGGGLDSIFGKTGLDLAPIDVIAGTLANDAFAFIGTAPYIAPPPASCADRTTAPSG